MSELRTHRGFLVRADTPSPGYLGSESYDKLRDHYRLHSDSAHDLGFIHDVCKAAKELLYPNGQNLFELQLQHGTSRWILSFVSTTLDYLNGIRRPISIENYLDLLEFHPSTGVRFDPQANAAKVRTWDWLLRLPPQQLIPLWLAQPAGLNDLVQALYLIGGKLPEQWHKHPKPISEQY